MMNALRSDTGDTYQCTSIKGRYWTSERRREHKEKKKRGKENIERALKEYGRIFERVEREERQKADERLERIQQEFTEDSRFKRLKWIEDVKEKDENNKARENNNMSEGYDKEIDSEKEVRGKRVKDERTIIAKDKNIIMRKGKIDETQQR